MVDPYKHFDENMNEIKHKTERILTEGIVGTFNYDSGIVVNEK